MIKHLLYISSVLLIAGLFNSCEDKIDIDLNDEHNQRLVIEGRFTNENKIHEITLSRTASYFANAPAPRESGASIVLTDGTISIPYFENSSIRGLYQTNTSVAGIIGNDYKLSIETNNNENFEAKTQMDIVAQMDSITWEYEYVDFIEEGFYILKLWANEPAGKGNIYMFNVYVNDSLDNKTLSQTSFQTDEYFDGQYLPGAEIYYIEEEKLIAGSNHIQVDMLSITRDEYDYNVAFIAETDYSGSIFSGPPANIPSNLKSTDGGLDGLGFFSVSAVTSYAFEIIKPE
ncbi:MAG: DUF4249 domain-containing protein [Bacteroidales bacterium]|nr:DUF4249 domain-containing protein [Bacteroidales bacterium]